MTIASNMGSKRERISKKVPDENAALLPTKRQEEAGFDEFNGASYSGAILNLSTTIVGSGIMALPATMKILGLGLGIFMIVFMALLTERSIDMLLKFSRAGKSSSYGAVMEDAFGNVGKLLLQVTILVNNIVALIIYIIIIGDVLSGTSSTGMHHAGVLEGWFGSHWWNGRSIVLLVTTLCILAPLACFKRIDSLSYTSGLSVGLAVMFLVIMVGITVIKLISGTVMMPKLLPNITDMNSFWNVFTAVPVLVTTYNCLYNVHSIDNELEGSTQIKGVVRTALGLCSLVYVMTSLFGFLLFGDGVLDDVLANFDTDLGIAYGGVLNDAVRVSYAAHLILVFPVIFYPLRLNIDALCFPSSAPLVSDNKRFALLTIVLICLIFLGATFIPTIWDVIQFAGATIAVSLVFVFPASITLRDCYGIATTKEKSLAIMMIVLAVFSNVVAIYSDTYALLKKNAVPAGI